MNLKIWNNERERNGKTMKKATLYLLMISLMGMLAVPVYAADVYEDELTDLYSFDEGIMCDDDFVTEYQADMSGEKLQKDFETVMQDDSIKLSEARIETMNLISINDYDIDTEYAVEVNDYASEMYAIGNCSAVQKSTGKIYLQLLRIGVTPTGKAVK